MPLPLLCWLLRTYIPNLSTAAPALSAGASPLRVPISSGCSESRWGWAPAHPPWPWAHSLTLSGPSRHWGGWRVVVGGGSESR